MFSMIYLYNLILPRSAVLKTPISERAIAKVPGNYSRQTFYLIDIQWGFFQLLCLCLSNMLTSHTKLTFFKKILYIRKGKTEPYDLPKLNKYRAYEQLSLSGPRLECFSSIGLHLYFVSLPINWTIHRKAITGKKVNRAKVCHISNIYVNVAWENMKFQNEWL